MSSTVDIVNAALTLLGESRIVSIDDNIKQAREAKAIFNITRDSLLGAYNWSFAKARVQLSALVDVPVFEYPNQYQLPIDCIRVVMVGDYYAGVDLVDYRGSPTEIYTIEGNRILTSLGAPLSLRYIKRVEDSSQMSSTFVMAFAASLAEKLCESLTQSETKRARAEKVFMTAISNAIRANAIELPPQKLADDDWIMSRL